MDFESVITEGYSAIRRIVDEGLEESHKIDFKLKSASDRPDLARDDKKALGEAASGFANAEGGLLIVGIETEDVHGIDRAKEVRAIRDVKVVAERYASYLAECVSPPVLGVRVAAVTESSGSSGVILIHIPQGNARPHMSVASGHHRFYRRVADRFQQMERYEIEEMFHLKSRPSLEIIFEYQPGGSLGSVQKSFICFGLRNKSNSSAKFPYISISNNENAPRLAEFGLDGNGGTLFKKLTTGPSEEIIFSGGSEIVIHPGQDLYISRLEYIHSNRDKLDRHWSVSNLGPNGECSIEFSFGCEDFSRQRISATFTSMNLLNFEAPRINAIDNRT